MDYLIEYQYVNKTAQGFYRISIDGQKFLRNGSFYGQENAIKEEERVKKLTTEKLETDLLIAKRIYKSYPLLW